MLERPLSLALAIAGPLFAAAPSFSMSLRLDHGAVLSSSTRAAIVVSSAFPTAQRQDALDLMVRTSSLAWRQIYAAPLGDVGERFAREPRVESGDGVATSVGDDAPDWESPTGLDPVPAVPEPAAAIAFGLGGLVVGASLLRARRRAHAARTPRA